MHTASASHSTSRNAHYSTRSPLMLGIYGHLAIFAWMIGAVMLVSGGTAAITAGVCLAVAVAIYPGTLPRLLRWRWLIWLLLLVLPTVFLLGERDSVWMGVRYSQEGLAAGVQITARFVVVLIAVQSFTSAVDVATLAGLLERFGLRGLGFSLGVAMNLLPSLQESAQHAWYALRMRGGLRKQRWRGLQLLIMTIVTNALRRADEVALAAEARAFSPEHTRPLPVRRGSLDWLPIALGTISLVVLAFV